MHGTLKFCFYLSDIVLQQFFLSIYQMVMSMNSFVFVFHLGFFFPLSNLNFYKVLLSLYSSPMLHVKNPFKFLPVKMLATRKNPWDNLANDKGQT